MVAGDSGMNGAIVLVVNKQGPDSATTQHQPTMGCPAVEKIQRNNLAAIAVKSNLRILHYSLPHKQNNQFKSSQIIIKQYNREK